MTEIEKLYENIKPVEVFPLCSCSKGEIKDYCTNKQYYRYCKAYKVNKIYPPFTAEKQLELIKWLVKNKYISINHKNNLFNIYTECKCYPKEYRVLEEAIADYTNIIWNNLTEQEQQQIKDILRR